MILSAYTKRTKEMASVMNKMINLKYVPCGLAGNVAVLDVVNSWF